MQITSIQILRALAALAVVIGHAQAFIGLPMEKSGQSFGWNSLLPWGAGVDLFFVISGFIMVYASEKLFAAPGGAATFLRRRLTRIVPLYWAATLLLLLKNYFQHKPLPELPAIAASLLFLPFDSTGAGLPRPVHELGWTLNYEMFFYVVFALCLFARRERAVAAVSVALALFVALGAELSFHNSVWQVWTQPIIVEFVFGMLIAAALRQQIFLPDVWRFNFILLGAILLCVDFLQSASQSHLWVTPNDLSRVVFWGGPAALIVAGCVLTAKSPSHKGLWLRAGGQLGDASYALYLFHPFVLGAFSALWFALHLNDSLPACVGVASSIFISIAVSLLVYRWFELPATRWLQSKAFETRTARRRVAILPER